MATNYSSDSAVLVHYQRLLLNQLHSLHHELLILQKEQQKLFQLRKDLLSGISPSPEQRRLGQLLLQEQQDLQARQVELLRQEKALFAELLP